MYSSAGPTSLVFGGCGMRTRDKGEIRFDEGQVERRSSAVAAGASLAQRRDLASLPVEAAAHCDKKAVRCEEREQHNSQPVFLTEQPHQRPQDKCDI